MAATLTSHEPATGALLWQGEAGEVDAEVARAHAAWPRWAAQPIAYRIETLRRFVNVVRRHEDALTDLIARETGKPLWDARAEVAAVMGKVDISVAAFSDRTGQRRLEAALGARQSVRHKPHGVMAVLGPYNFPGHLPNGHIVPALLAGDTVVFKPSEETPLTGQLMAECLDAADLPKGVFNMVQGGRDTGAALLDQPIDALMFTGSGAAGAHFRRKFADDPHVILALELGGNNPLVVWDAADA